MLGQALDRWVAATLTDFSPLVLVLLWTLCPALSTTPLLLCAPPTRWMSSVRVSFSPLSFCGWVSSVCVFPWLSACLSPFGLLCAEVTFAIGRMFKSKSYQHLLTIFMLPKCVLTCNSTDRSACSVCGVCVEGGMCVCTRVCMSLWDTGVCVHAWVTDADGWAIGECMLVSGHAVIFWKSFCFPMHYGNVYLALYFKFLEIIISCLVESWIPHLLFCCNDRTRWPEASPPREGGSHERQQLFHVSAAQVCCLAARRCGSRSLHLQQHVLCPTDPPGMRCQPCHHCAVMQNAGLRQISGGHIFCPLSLGKLRECS